VAHRTLKKTRRKRAPFSLPHEFGGAPAPVDVGLGRKERGKGWDVCWEEAENAGQVPHQGLEDVVATPAVGARWLAGEGCIVRRPYAKSKRKFLTCGCEGTSFRAQ